MTHLSTKQNKSTPATPRKKSRSPPKSSANKGQQADRPPRGQRRSGASGRKPTGHITPKTRPQDLRLVGNDSPIHQTKQKHPRCPPAKSHAHHPSHPPAKGSKPTDPSGGQQRSRTSGRKPTVLITPKNRPQDPRLVGKDPPTLQTTNTNHTKKSRSPRGKRLFL